MNQIVPFLTDLIKRFFKPTPTFFRIVQVIGLIAAAVMKAPDLLGHPIESLSSAWKFAIEVAGITVAVVAQLPVKPDTVDTLKLK